MFGVEKPFKDLMKREIANRLIMFGAFLDASERVVFTNDVEGRESFYRLFLQGHAVKNYYFFVSSDFSGEIRKETAADPRGRREVPQADVFYH